MNARQSEAHFALIVEDNPAVRELAAALREETELDVVEVDGPRLLWPICRSVEARWR